MRKDRTSIHDICTIGVFTAIIVVVSQVSIPLPYGVPMTLQTLIIPLAGIVLGTKRGTVSAIVYVLLGAVGLPVFAGFSGGFGSIVGMSGGFILSFPLMAFTAGIAMQKEHKVWICFWLILGSAMNYLCGMLVFSLVTLCDLKAAFTACVLPFIPTATAKVIMLGILSGKLKRVLGSHNVNAAAKEAV